MKSISFLFEKNRKTRRYPAYWYEGHMLDLTFIHRSEVYRYWSTSSIRASFQPSNCMIILCRWVPWRKASTLGAAA